jgi:hypothetical protein
MLKISFQTSNFDNTVQKISSSLEVIKKIFFSQTSILMENLSKSQKRTFHVFD